jgi:hypothetical protein
VQAPGGRQLERPEGGIGVGGAAIAVAAAAARGERGRDAEAGQERADCPPSERGERPRPGAGGADGSDQQDGARRDEGERLRGEEEADRSRKRRDLRAGRRLPGSALERQQVEEQRGHDHVYGQPEDPEQAIQVERSRWARVATSSRRGS